MAQLWPNTTDHHQLPSSPHQKKVTTVFCFSVFMSLLARRVYRAWLDRDYIQLSSGKYQDVWIYSRPSCKDDWVCLTPSGVDWFSTERKNKKCSCEVIKTSYVWSKCDNTAISQAKSPYHNIHCLQQLKMKAGNKLLLLKKTRPSPWSSEWETRNHGRWGRAGGGAELRIRSPHSCSCSSGNPTGEHHSSA